MPKNCREVWECVLKPIGYGLLGLLVVSALSVMSRQDGNPVEIVLCGSIALCFVAMGCIFIGEICVTLWRALKSRRSSNADA